MYRRLASCRSRGSIALWRGLIVLLLALTIALSWQHGAPAQSLSSLQARISRLETENTTLRSRVRQLENGLSRLSRGGGMPESPSALERSPVASQLADDPMFERLATLVIELRERIVAVENRVTNLEN